MTEITLAEAVARSLAATESDEAVKLDEAIELLESLTEEEGEDESWTDEGWYRCRSCGTVEPRIEEHGTCSYYIYGTPDRSGDDLYLETYDSDYDDWDRDRYECSECGFSAYDLKALIEVA